MFLKLPFIYGVLFAWMVMCVFSIPRETQAAQIERVQVLDYPCPKTIDAFLLYCNRFCGDDKKIVFKCLDKKSDKPVCTISVDCCRNRIIETKVGLYKMMKEVSLDWFIITGSFRVDVCDGEGKVVYRLTKGKIFLVSEVI